MWPLVRRHWVASEESVTAAETLAILGPRLASKEKIEDGDFKGVGWPTFSLDIDRCLSILERVGVPVGLRFDGVRLLDLMYSAAYAYCAGDAAGRLKMYRAYRESASD